MLPGACCATGSASADSGSCVAQVFVGDLDETVRDGQDTLKKGLLDALIARDQARNGNKITGWLRKTDIRDAIKEVRTTQHSTEQRTAWQQAGASVAHEAVRVLWVLWTQSKDAGACSWHHAGLLLWS